MCERITGCAQCVLVHLRKRNTFNNIFEVISDGHFFVVKLSRRWWAKNLKIVISTDNTVESSLGESRHYVAQSMGEEGQGLLLRNTEALLDKFVIRNGWVRSQNYAIVVSRNIWKFS